MLAQSYNGSRSVDFYANSASKTTAILASILPSYRPRKVQYRKFDNTIDARRALIGKDNSVYAAPITLSILPGEVDG